MTVADAVCQTVYTTELQKATTPEVVKSEYDRYDEDKYSYFPLYSVTALLVGEKLPPEAEIYVSYFFILTNKQEYKWITGFLLSILLTKKKKKHFSQDDPFKLKTGGIVDMKKVKDRNRDM